MAAGTTTQLASRSSWLAKLCACFFGCLALINILSMGTSLLPRPLSAKFEILSAAVSYGGELVLSLFFAFVLCWYWQWMEKRSNVKAIFFHPVLTGVLRYSLAFGICTYGFAKVLKTQFAHSFTREDSLVHNLNGISLTWQYFSRSYAMAAIIGLTQISGSVLLLFRRTTLLGTVILLPVMINILLINLFYQIAPGAFFNAAIYTADLLYLLLLRWHELKKIFITATDRLPRLRWGMLKYPIKLLPVIAAFFTIYQYTSQNSPNKLEGKWTVDFMIRYGDTVKTDAWLTDASIWSNVYLEQHGMIAVCANPYMFDRDKSLAGTYQYNDSLNIVQLAFPNRTVNIAVSKFDGNKMEWRSMIKKDSLFVVMRRTSVP